MKKQHLALAIAILAMGLSGSCSKTDDDVNPTPDGGSKKFVVLSDIHLMHPDLLVHEGEAFDKYNWEECKLLRESPEIFAATLERARAYNPDFLIVCGDMTKDGEIISHKYVAEKLNEFSKQTGARILVVPGNHDLTNPHSLRYDGAESTPERSATEKDFEDIYALCGYSDAVAHGPRRLDYMSYPADGIAFIGLDSNEQSTPDKVAVQGGLTKAQTLWVADMVKKAHSDNRYVIMGMHHNLLEFYNNASLIRGANIANARYEYDNGQLVTDLCNAGIARKLMDEDEELSYEEAYEQATTAVGLIVYGLLGKDLDEAKSMMYDFFDSAYHNYYGTNRTPVPDDFITLQLSKC